MINVTIIPKRRSKLVLHSGESARNLGMHLRRACDDSGYYWPDGRIEVSGTTSLHHVAVLLGILHESGQINVVQYGAQRGTVRRTEVRRNGYRTMQFNDLVGLLTQGGTASCDAWRDRLQQRPSQRRYRTRRRSS